MSKFYIDGKLVGDMPAVNSAEFVTPAMAKFAATIDWDAVRLHDLAGCLIRPFYFCPECARLALRGVDVSDPSGWRDKP